VKRLIRSLIRPSDNERVLWATWLHNENRRSIPTDDTPMRPMLADPRTVELMSKKYTPREIAAFRRAAARRYWRLGKR